MKVLFYGNSFSVDASRYLHGISRAAGNEISVGNLCYPGCSLFQHYTFLLSGEAKYEYFYDGFSTKIFLPSQQALLSDDWDVVVLQESSRKAGTFDTYQPYLGELAAHIRRCRPRAKLAYHMSWTYPKGSRIFDQTPFSGPEEMFPGVVATAERAAEEMGADLLVPSGKAMYRLCAEAGEEAYRDSFHCNKGQSRYMLGLLWYMALTGRSAESDSFRDFDVPVTEEQAARARRIAVETAREAGFLTE